MADAAAAGIDTLGFLSAADMYVSMYRDHDPNAFRKILSRRALALMRTIGRTLSPPQVTSNQVADTRVEAEKGFLPALSRAGVAPELVHVIFPRFLGRAELLS